MNTICIAHLGIALVFENCDKPYDIFGTSDVTEATYYVYVPRAVCTTSDCYIDTEPCPQPCGNLMIALLIPLTDRFLININVVDGAIHTDIQLVIIGCQMLVLIHKLITP